MKTIYLDHSASTSIHPEVLEAMNQAGRDYLGNPSSLHTAGARSRKKIEECREIIAGFIQSDPREIIFTSGGTESINQALKGTVWSLPVKPHIISSAIEHKAVLKTLEFLKSKDWISLSLVPVDSAGRISLEEIQKHLLPETRILSLMLVNNETGNIYHLNECISWAQEHNIIFHVDAVQALGKVKISLRETPVHLMSFSAHKIHGPTGVGALYVKKNTPFVSLIHGGPQEFEKRAGTENFLGIVGFAKALEVSMRDFDENQKKLLNLKKKFEEGLSRMSSVCVNGDLFENRIAQTTHATFKNISAETLMIKMDQKGIAVSAGSACASGALEPSHVLLAMGFSKKDAKSSIRFSLGSELSENDIEEILKVVRQCISELK